MSSNGDGGNIIVNATETDPSTPTILLDTTSSISSEMGSETTGDGTSITLEGASIQLQAGSEIRATNAGSGNGGTIQFSNLSTDTPGLSQRIEVNGTAGSPVIETTVSGSGRGSDIIFNGNVIDINSAEIKADTSSDAIAGTGGNIEIRGQQLSLDAETTISANTTGAANSGAIILSGTGSSTIDTPSLTLDGTTISNTASSSGASGRVQLQGAAIELSNGVEIRADNSGSSPGGGVSIEGTQSVQVDQSSISTSTSGSGAGGDINIKVTSGELTLSDSNLQSRNEGTGIGGSVRLEALADTVTLRDDSSIDASTGDGSGGNVSIAAQSVRLQGKEPANTPQPSGTRINTSTAGSGAGGSINIKATAGEINLSRAQLQSASRAAGEGGDVALNSAGDVLLQESLVDINTNQGAGGNVLVEGATIELDDTAINASTRGAGAGGSVQLNGARDISLTGASTIQATSQQSGPGGAVEMIAGRTVTLQEASVINASTAGGTGGSVSVRGDRIQLIGIPDSDSSQPNTAIKTDSTGAGNGGEIKIEATGSGKIELTGTDSFEVKNSDTAALLLSNGAAISATSSGSGDGGNISLQAVNGDIALTEASKVNASTNSTAQAGDVAIAAQTLLIQGNVAAGLPIAPPIPDLSVPDAPAPNVSEPNPNRSEIITRSEPSDPNLANVENLRGGAGNIRISAGDVILNYSALIADTEETNRNRKQGNIDIVSNTGGQLSLSNESLISARGSTQNARGGNIIIEGFSVVSGGTNLPGFNGSDIVTSADRDRQGGIVRILSPSFEFVEQFAEPGNATNDISSDGEVELIDSGFERGFREVEFAFIDLSDLVGQECRVGSSETGSRFTLSGRGGVSRSPLENLPAEFSNDDDWVVMEAFYAEPSPLGSLEAETEDSSLENPESRSQSESMLATHSPSQQCAQQWLDANQ